MPGVPVISTHLLYTVLLRLWSKVAVRGQNYFKIRTTTPLSATSQEFIIKTQTKPNDNYIKYKNALPQCPASKLQLLMTSANLV